MESTVTYYLWAIGICFFGSCFFSAAETALTTLSPVQCERLATSRSWFNRSISLWVKFPHRLLATNLVGNTLVNMAAATMTTVFVATYYPFISIVWVTSGLTLMILIFGEIAPKMIARSMPEQIAPFACRVLIGLNFLFYPVTFIITNMIKGMMKSFGVIIQTKRFIRSQDIEYMVDLAQRDGSLERDKTRILTSIFEFSKRRVKDIMIPRDQMSSISVEATLLEVLDIVRRDNHTRYPVYKSNLDRIIGFFHARDLFGALKAYGFTDSERAKIKSFSLRTCLRRAFFVSEHSMISRVLNEMKSNRIHLAIVKDEWGTVVGLVTLEDILEEVFGDIEDEHDDFVQRPIVDMYGTGIEVDGSISLLDLKSRYEVNIEEAESYSTLNGFLQHYAGHQHISTKMIIIWRNYVFSLLVVAEGEIEKVRITQNPDEERD